MEVGELSPFRRRQPEPLVGLSPEFDHGSTDHGDILEDENDSEIGQIVFLTTAESEQDIFWYSQHFPLGIAQEDESDYLATLLRSLRRSISEGEFHSILMETKQWLVAGDFAPFHFKFHVRNFGSEWPNAFWMWLTAEYEEVDALNVLTSFCIEDQRLEVLIPALGFVSGLPESLLLANDDNFVNVRKMCLVAAPHIRRSQVFVDFLGVLAFNDPLTSDVFGLLMAMGYVFDGEGARKILMAFDSLTYEERVDVCEGMELFLEATAQQYGAQPEGPEAMRRMIELMAEGNCD